MSGVTSASIDGVSCWISPGRSDRLGERQLELVERVERVLAHHDDDARLDDRDLLGHARDARRVGERAVADGALHAERPVDGERVDVQAPERLAQRGAGAAVEGDALLDLRGLRRVLEQEHVGLRVAGAEHRHQAAARAVAAGLQVARQRVDLADRALEVLLADVVIGRGHGCPGIRRSRSVSLALHQPLRAARLTRRWRTARRARRGGRARLQELQRLHVE